MTSANIFAMVKKRCDDDRWMSVTIAMFLEQVLHGLTEDTKYSFDCTLEAHRSKCGCRAVVRCRVDGCRGEVCERAEVGRIDIGAEAVCEPCPCNIQRCSQLVRTPAHPPTIAHETGITAELKTLFRH